MTDFNFRKYGKVVYGLKCKRGKGPEFDEICERLRNADDRLKYLALFDPDNEYDAAKAERDSILEELKAVSNPI